MNACLLVPMAETTVSNAYCLCLVTVLVNMIDVYLALI